MWGRSNEPTSNGRSTSIKGKIMSKPSLTRRLWLLASIALAACQSGNGSNTTTSAVGSVDRVRPDVREYIESEFASEFEKKAALQFAADIQGDIDSADDAELTRRRAAGMSRAMDCMYYVFPRSKSFPPHARAYAVQRELEARTLNTKERSLAYIRSSKHLGGSVWRSRNDNELPGTCDFDLTGFEVTVLP